MDSIRLHSLTILHLVHASISSTAPPDIPSRDPSQQPSRSQDSILTLPQPLLCLLARQTDILLQTQEHKQYEYDKPLLLKRLDDLLRIARQKFYVFPFKDVPEAWRRLGCEAGIVKAAALLLGFSGGEPSVDDVGKGQRGQDDAMTERKVKVEGGCVALHRMVDEVVKTLDNVLIMSGAPGEGRREWIERTFELLEGLLELESTRSEDYIETVGPREKRRKLAAASSFNDTFPNTSSFIPPVMNPIGRVAGLPMEAFERHMRHPHDPDMGPVPLVIIEAIEHWPARHERPWKSPQYLLKKTLGGRRLVPVEVGRSYVDGGWGQRIVPFKGFLDEFILNPSLHRGQAVETKIDSDGEVNGNVDHNESEDEDETKTGYLAQHDLFSQIPSLRSDIAIPDFCYLTPPPPHKSSPLAAQHARNPQLEEPLLNAWFGPAGTISPLHVDPYHNILTQVVGRKYVRLYAPRETWKLVPRGQEGGVDMVNTSSVDVGGWEGWDRVPEEDEGDEDDGRGAVDDVDKDYAEESKRERYRERFNCFGEAQFVDVILEEGECLYIPVGWWHYVRSLSVSFSVSFWWN